MLSVFVKSSTFEFCNHTFKISSYGTINMLYVLKEILTANASTK